MVGNDGLRLVEDGKNGEIYHTDGDTTIVLMEAVYDGGKYDYDIDEWDVSAVNDLDDIIQNGKVDDDGYISKVQVVKSDDQYAQLIYIKNYKPEPLSSDNAIGDVAVKGLPVTFDENNEATVTVTKTQNDTENAKLSIGHVAANATVYVEISGVDGEWTKDGYSNTDPFSTAGERTITIEVTAEDGTKATYTIDVTVNAEVAPVVIDDNMGDNATAKITVEDDTITVASSEPWDVAKLKSVLTFKGIVEGSARYVTNDADTDKLETAADDTNLYNGGVILVVTRAEDGKSIQYNIVKTSGT